MINSLLSWVFACVIFSVLGKACPLGVQSRHGRISLSTDSMEKLPRPNRLLGTHPSSALHWPNLSLDDCFIGSWVLPCVFVCVCVCVRLRVCVCVCRSFCVAVTASISDKFASDSEMLCRSLALGFRSHLACGPLVGLVPLSARLPFGMGLVPLSVVL